MIRKRSDFVYAVVAAAAVPSRPPIHSFIHSFSSFILSDPPSAFFPLPPLPLGHLSVTCPTMRSFHLKLHVHVHTPYDTKGASAQVTLGIYVLYCTLHVPYIGIHTSYDTKRASQP